ncbi:MAG: RNA methyltransferase [Muribaculaceae bacterium]|nr:RNA methyltransferase [Muribaculaceae bacterium]
MNTEIFDMVAKTFQGLEDVLAEELRSIGAINVEPGRRMVSFQGDKEMLYKANLHCRTALRILKPFYSFRAHTADKLYDRVKEFDWNSLLSPEKTFAIDVTVNSSEFTNSRFVTYRVKDAIVDFFTDRDPQGKRPSVRLTDADVMINVHIAESDVTLSLDSSGESLHKRGWREAQTEAPINEVLAAGIILKTGWRGNTPFVDPMCGSGTFLVEAALIAANIAPGIYRKSFAFERWSDFDAELWDRLYNDDSAEREILCPIIGADMSPKAVAITTENLKRAGVAGSVTVELKPLSQWTEAPADGVLVTNPPYGERLRPDDIDALYSLIGSQLKHVFTGYHAWIIGYRDEQFAKIGLAPSFREPLLNGALECELREYIIFQGDRKSFRAAGGKLQTRERAERPRNKSNRPFDKSRKPFARRKDDSHVRGGADRHEKSAPIQRPEISENPLAARRNPEALKAIIGKMPSISARKGWRRKSGGSETPTKES